MLPEDSEGFFKIPFKRIEVMAMSMAKRARLTEKLREQLRFIQRSCEAFDKGAEEEALRIATSLRVIFHDTSTSVSLISHLDFGGKKMLSSARGLGDWRDYLGHKLDLTSPKPVVMFPLFGDKFRALSLRDWWSNEPVFTHNSQRFSRRKIILSAANKDGGAHVDAKLEKYYEILCAGEYAISIIGNLTYTGEPPFPQGVPQYPKNAHLALIRQFAHETLVTNAHFTWLKDES
jgi:hypothetical protein